MRGLGKERSMKQRGSIDTSTHLPSEIQREWEAREVRLEGKPRLKQIMMMKTELREGLRNWLDVAED